MRRTDTSGWTRTARQDVQHLRFIEPAPNAQDLCAAFLRSPWPFERRLATEQPCRVVMISQNPRFMGRDKELALFIPSPPNEQPHTITHRSQPRKHKVQDNQKIDRPDYLHSAPLPARLYAATSYTQAPLPSSHPLLLPPTPQKCRERILQAHPAQTPPKREPRTPSLNSHHWPGYRNRPSQSSRPRLPPLPSRHPSPSRLPFLEMHRAFLPQLYVLLCRLGRCDRRPRCSFPCCRKVVTADGTCCCGSEGCSKDVFPATFSNSRAAI
jgi:hypothetical protein